MLSTVSSVLLLTNVNSFAEEIRLLAEGCDIKLTVESEWKDSYRVKEDIILCGSKYLEKINRAYLPNIVLILKDTESPVTFIKEGVTRFIFNHKDHREFIYAFCKADKVFVKNASASVKEVLQKANATRFYTDIYDFNFSNNKFYYKGKGIYLTDCEKAYLAEWLLNGHKDNKNRMKLCIMRKKFGETFLQDVDRHGQVKEK